MTSKIVSKAEDRFVRAEDRDQAITDETVRVVARRDTPGGTIRIVENRLGIIAAAAGVDSSSVPVGTVLLLPVDPDASARRIVDSVREQLGIRVGVVVTDMLGARVAHRADGCGDRRGRDTGGPRHEGSPRRVRPGDERDGDGGRGWDRRATDLVTGKADGSTPVAVVRGLSELVDREEPSPPRSARILLRPTDEDMFHTGAAESWGAGYRAALRDHGIDP